MKFIGSPFVSGASRGEPGQAPDHHPEGRPVSAPHGHPRVHVRGGGQRSTGSAPRKCLCRYDTISLSLSNTWVIYQLCDLGFVCPSLMYCSCPVYPILLGQVEICKDVNSSLAAMVENQNLNQQKMVSELMDNPGY